MNISNDINNRVAYFDNLKLLLIYFVVLGHFAETADSSSFAPIIRFGIYTFHMPLFVFVSGLFFNVENVKNGINRGIGFLTLYVIMKITSWVVELLLFGEISFSLFRTVGMPWFLFALGVWCILTPAINKIMDLKVFAILIVILALIIGYDSSVNSYLVLSRIIVFWPYFILGAIINNNNLLKVIKKRKIVILSLITIIFVLIALVCCFDSINIISPMLSGQNPYYSLGRFEKYGFIIRGFVYLLATIMSVSIMAIVPSRRFSITKIGERTISIYFYDVIVYSITVYCLTSLHMWQYAIISIGIVVLFSADLFYKPLRYILRVNT